MAHPAAAHRRPAETDKGLVAKVVALFLGLLVAVLGFFTLLMWADARDSRESELAATTATAHDHSAHASASGAVSFAGAAPANAEQLAKAHVAYPAALPAVPAGGVVKVHMVLKDVTVQIAPGVKYAAWGFEGGAPGPIVHVRQGQTVEMTLTNGGAIPHSIDFHAARIAPNEAFTDVMPGASFTFRFRAADPGVYMYHCGTKPVLAHIANGMYGAIVVDPAVPLPEADREYVLVASEWYLSSDGLSEPASLDVNPAHALHGVQTATVPAGGGGVFEVRIDEPGLYPFVSHAFAHVDLGQVGLLKVGKPTGTMSH